MQRGIGSIVALAQKIEENQALKADFVAPARELEVQVQSDGKLGLLMPEPTGITLRDNTTLRQSIPAIRPVAHSQLATYTKVPATYYDRMLREEPELLARNVNTWLGKSTDRRMIRTLGGDMRAFLSDRYQRIENEEIAEVVLPVLMEAKVKVVSCEVTERRLYINAVLPSLQGEVKVGDVMVAGVSIGNSEIGLGAASISAFLYRLVCLNGMQVPDGSLKARHVGRRVQEGEDLNAIFADDTRKADDRAILLKIRDTVKHALDEAKFKARLDKMRTLTEGKVTGDPTKVVELLAQKVGATEAEKPSLLRSIIEGGDLTAWGLLNAVTHQAHNAELSYDRSMEFVQAGGQLLELPTTEWKRILEAA